MTDALIDSDEPGELAGDGGGEDGRDSAPLVGGDRSRGNVVERTGGWLRTRTVTEWVTFVIVVGCASLVFWSLQPQFLLSSTIPTGGDMSAHVWGPAFLRDHLLPRGQITGWSPDWYAGYPAFQFYMVLPFLAIALLSYVIPYGVAFKLVAISGCVSLPVACYLFGRLNRLPFPVAPMLAMGGTYFLYDRGFSIYGGNIASTLAGEFCFSISLSLAVVYLGVVGAGLRTGRYRGWAAVLLALTGLCHLIPFLFAIGATIIWLAVRPGLRSLQYLVTAGPVGVALTGFWLIPFYGKGGYVNDMGWEKVTDFREYLLTRDLPDSTLRNIPDLRTLIVVAAVGLVLALILRYRDLLYLGVVAAAVAALFGFLGKWSLPVIGDKLWNARLLPFYYLCIYLLAAAGLALALVLLAKLFAAGDRPLEKGMRIGGAAIAGLVLLVVVGATMKILPGGSVGVDGQYRWGVGPFSYTVKETNYVADWAKWNFQGLEGWEQDVTGTDADGKPVLGPVTYDRSYPEFYRLVQTMKQVGAEHGCGRAMWEYEDQHNRYGSPMEPMLLPYFTDSCIGSMEGLYFEASSTTPYHFINSTELSKQGSAAQREMPYPSMPPSQTDFDLGVQHLQMLGVRYYLAIDDYTKGLAAGNPDLVPLTTSDSWSIYQVADSDLIVPLTNEPAVLTGQPVKGDAWRDTSVCWYMHPDNWTVPLVDRNLGNWQEVAPNVAEDPDATPQERCHLGEDGWGWFTGGTAPETRPLPEVEVTNVQTTMDTISFDVSEPGVPVLIKTSYFPNWKVSGADGIARSTPNLMVVTPTSTHVELSYGRTGLDWFAYLVTLAGIACLVLLVRAGPLVPAAPARYWWPTERPDLAEAAARRHGPDGTGADGDPVGADGPYGPLGPPEPAGPPGPAPPPGPDRAAGASVVHDPRVPADGEEVERAPIDAGDGPSGADADAPLPAPEEGP